MGDAAAAHAAPPITTAAFAAMVAIAAWIDFRMRRIPNAVSVGGLAVALILRAPHGWESLVDGLLGAALGLGLALPFFLVGGLGGGDVKLLVAVGAFMGTRQLVGACLLIALLGGVFAVVDAARRGALRLALLNVFYMLTRWISPHRRALSPTLVSPAAMSIPYGVPIAVGALLWWFLGRAII